MKKTIREVCQKYKHVGLYKYSRVLISYQNSGSTWLSSILTNIITKREPKNQQIKRIFNFVGNHRKKGPDNKTIIKSHEPFRKEYRNKKLLYLVRDPRDVAISKYHKSIKENWYIPSKKEFMRKFSEGRIMSEGRWDYHVESYIEAKKNNYAKVFFVRYEDLKNDTKMTVKKICKFFEIEAQDDIIERSIENSSIEKLKKKLNNARKGKMEEWKNELSRNEEKLFENKLGKVMKKLGYLK